MVKKNKAVSCIVCGESDFKSVSLLDGKKAIGCNNCLLEWRDPFPSDSQLEDLYGKSYFKQKGKFEAGYPDYDIFLGSYEEYFARQFKRIAKLHPIGGLVVDVGCGPGVFLNEAKKGGYKVLGVDISEIAVKKSWKRYGIKVLQKDFERCRFKPGSVDVVTCFQTFEHMRDPLSFLKAVHEALSPSGTFILTTLNVNSMWRTVLGKRWFSYTHKVHLYFFQEKNIRMALKKSGFNQNHFFSDNWRMYNGWELVSLTSAYGVKGGFRFHKSNLWRVTEKLRVPFPIGSIGVVARKGKILS